MQWVPFPYWEGETSYCVGGGPSLKGFDWTRLKGKNVIAINSAFTALPLEMVSIVLFGDRSFFKLNEAALKQVAQKVPVISCAPGVDVSWLLVAPRIELGLSQDHIGWNYNSGAAAISLSLLLGCSKTYLLGYDLGHKNGEASHWYTKGPGALPDERYGRFHRGFIRLFKDLPRVFPGREVINLTDGTSKLDVFSVEDRERHFKGRE